MRAPLAAGGALCRRPGVGNSTDSTELAALVSSFDAALEVSAQLCAAMDCWHMAGYLAALPRRFQSASNLGSESHAGLEQSLRALPSVVHAVARPSSSKPFLVSPTAFRGVGFLGPSPPPIGE